MTNQLWLNLPVKDVEKSKAFFSKLGFSFNTQHGNSPVSASLVIGKNVIMLFEENTFKTFTKSEITNTAETNEMLISIDAESKKDVDEMANKIAMAGGNVFSKPAEIDGWMYGCAFSDPDGHRWNILYMDMSKMPNR
jgi:predicted lactoylglutathione lyase